MCTVARFGALCASTELIQIIVIKYLPILPNPTIPTVLPISVGPHIHRGFHVPHPPLKTNKQTSSVL